VEKQAARSGIFDWRIEAGLGSAAEHLFQDKTGGGKAVCASLGEGAGNTGSDIVGGGIRGMAAYYDDCQGVGA